MFRDISRGYTTTELFDVEVYIKHLTTHDQVDLEEIKDEYYADAQFRGVPTEEEMLNFLRGSGEWEDSDDEEIKKLEEFIEILQSQKSHLLLKSKIDQQNQLIEIERAKLSEKLYEKQQLVGTTCEKYSTERVNDFYIIKSFYYDTEFTKPIFNEETYGELDDKQLKKVIEVYNKAFNIYSEENIKRLVLEDFYFVYFPFAEDSMKFFGLPVCALTYNQIKLIVFTRVFKSIFENNDNIPESIKSDPEALIDYANSAEKAKQKMQEVEDRDGATTLFGATKEDIDQIKQQTGVGKTVSLRDEAIKKGGKLSMDDLMKLSGQ